MFGAIAGALGGAAQGMTPAVRDVLQRRSQERQQTNDRYFANQDRQATQQYRQDVLAQNSQESERTAAFRAEELAAREREAARRHALGLAELEVERAKVNRTMNNAAGDLDARRAERAAAAITAHARTRPTQSDGLYGPGLARALAQWESEKQDILRLYAFPDEEAVGAAMMGRPSTHNYPGESGSAQMATEYVRREAESASQRLLRLKEESGMTFREYGRYQRDNGFWPSDSTRVPGPGR